MRWQRPICWILGHQPFTMGSWCYIKVTDGYSLKFEPSPVKSYPGYPDDKRTHIPRHFHCRRGWHHLNGDERSLNLDERWDRPSQFRTEPRQ